MQRYGKYLSNQNVFAAIIALLITDWVFRPKTSHRSTYQDYLQSDHWKRVRYVVGEEADWHCQVAGCGCYGHNLNAHHLHYRSLGEEREGDVIYVCPRHHKLIHKNNAFNRLGGGIIPAFSYR